MKGLLERGRLDEVGLKGRLEGEWRWGLERYWRGRDGRGAGYAGTTVYHANISH